MEASVQVRLEHLGRRVLWRWIIGGAALALVGWLEGPTTWWGASYLVVSAGLVLGGLWMRLSREPTVILIQSAVTFGTMILLALWCWREAQGSEWPLALLLTLYAVFVVEGLVEALNLFRGYKLLRQVKAFKEAAGRSLATDDRDGSDAVED